MSVPVTGAATVVATFAGMLAARALAPGKRPAPGLLRVEPQRGPDGPRARTCVTDTAALATSETIAPEREPSQPFAGFFDVRLPVTVILGTGTITVRRCLTLRRNTVLRLDQSAGEDLLITVNDVRLARGEVMILDDSTAVRITGFVKAPGRESPV